MSEVEVFVLEDGVLFLVDSEDVRRIVEELRELGVEGEGKVVYCG